jgi:hypothetical protein
MFGCVFVSPRLDPWLRARRRISSPPGRVTSRARTPLTSRPMGTQRRWPLPVPDLPTGIARVSEIARTAAWDQVSPERCRLPALSYPDGDGTPSAVKPSAMARRPGPARYSAKIRRTKAAVAGSGARARSGCPVAACSAIAARTRIVMRLRSLLDMPPYSDTTRSCASLPGSTCLEPRLGRPGCVPAGVRGAQRLRRGRTAGCPVTLVRRRSGVSSGVGQRDS